MIILMSSCWLGSYCSSVYITQPRQSCAPLMTALVDCPSHWTSISGGSASKVALGHCGLSLSVGAIGKSPAEICRQRRYSPLFFMVPSLPPLRYFHDMSNHHQNIHRGWQADPRLREYPLMNGIPIVEYVFCWIFFTVHARNKLWLLSR